MENTTYCIYKSCRNNRYVIRKCDTSYMDILKGNDFNIGKIILTGFASESKTDFLFRAYVCKVFPKIELYVDENGCYKGITDLNGKKIF